MGGGMLKNDTKLMESVIALAEELHFGRAARKLRISQPMLTKNMETPTTSAQIRNDTMVGRTR